MAGLLASTAADLSHWQEGDQGAVQVLLHAIKRSYVNITAIFYWNPPALHGHHAPKATEQDQQWIG